MLPVFGAGSLPWGRSTSLPSSPSACKFCVKKKSMWFLRTITLNNNTHTSKGKSTRMVFPGTILKRRLWKEKTSQPAYHHVTFSTKYIPFFPTNLCKNKFFSSGIRCLQCLIVQKAEKSSKVQDWNDHIILLPEKLLPIVRCNFKENCNLCRSCRSAFVFRQVRYTACKELWQVYSCQRHDVQL